MAPSPSLSWLRNLKSTQLRSLAAAIGTTSSGSKPALVSQIQFQLQHGLLAENHKPAPGSVGADSGSTGHDIISIDMGIRNLAFCHITLPTDWSTNPVPSRGQADQVPLVKRWARFAVASLEPKSPMQDIQNTSGDDPSSVDPGTVDAINVQAPVTPKTEAYDPKTLSAQAYLLICGILGLPSSSPGPQDLREPAFPAATLSPSTHILIERQRFRSMGGAAVQEWTLRVNMLEAMLYAVLRTLQETGRWRGHVHAVMPSQVARYWLDDEALDTLGGSDDVRSDTMDAGIPKKASSRKRSKGAQGSSSSVSARTKTAKIRLVEQWLEAALLTRHDDDDVNPGSTDAGRPSPLFAMHGQAQRTGTEYLQRRRGAGRKRRTRRPEDLASGPGKGSTMAPPPAVELGKLDDLADCLMQGMAWVKWEEKRRQILTSGDAGV